MVEEGGARNPTALKSARQPSRKMNSPSQEGLESGFLLRDRTLSSGKLYPHRCPRESGRIYLVLRPRSLLDETTDFPARRIRERRSWILLFLYIHFLRFAFHSIIDVPQLGECWMGERGRFCDEFPFQVRVKLENIIFVRAIYTFRLLFIHA